MATNGQPPDDGRPMSRLLRVALTSSASGAITGKPTKAGEVKLTATVVDSLGASTTKELVVNVEP